MSGLRRSKTEAALLFALILAGVLGGMAWATVASIKLAEKTIEQERGAKIDRALNELEQYIVPVINTEAARPWTDYRATYFEDPISIVMDGRQANVDPSYVDVELPSPLLPVNREWRPYDWIDIYFQIDVHQEIISPQFPDETDHIPLYTGVDLRTRTAWHWLQQTLPFISLPEKMAEARRRESLKDITLNGTALANSNPLEAQAGYIPPDRCVDPRVIAQNIPGQPAGGVGDSDVAEGENIGVSTKHTGIAPPFWIDPGRKLAFVREVYADADVLRQGFVADWERLKAELIARVQPIFADVELFPKVDGWPNNLAPNEIDVPLLPLVMRVPEFAAAPRTAAWQSTRSVLLISWSAALAVLLVAGWGVMNLVALTERRMQFAYAVTHELRTPLTTFRLYSDMLSAGLVPEERRQEYLDTLNRESLRLSTMVESVLEYARLENRHAKLHIRETDAASLLHTVGETLDKRCSDNGIQGRKINDIHNGLAIRTDVDLVSQITGVLVNNACRHAKSSKTPTVELRLNGDESRLMLDVVDSGPGVDLADSRRIFKPFRRGRDADSSARGGIGLGLALARSWAVLLGGRLELMHRHHPELGGAHFRLTIPTKVSD